MVPVAAPRFPTTWPRNDGLWGREWACVGGVRRGRKEELRCACARDERPSTPPRFQGSQTRSEFKLERNLASNRGYYFLQHCERAFYAFTVPGCLAIETIKCKNFWYDARGISPGKLGWHVRGGDRDSSVKLLTRVSFLSSLAVSIEVKETSKPCFTNVSNF